ncbi:zinc-dependent metalloprotease [Pyxidicoccus trucidator]|uniref:zinc-dependent metalloprotease n=1 Tax=Pyxidicoccus trucidator TaxID=2709662 RepID=UPI0013DD2352|nr:zinc-dependent metalloprotease [Pyxidicoccus trucidator]
MSHWSPHTRRAWWGAVSLALALSTGCGDTSGASTPEAPASPESVLQVELEEAFVAIPRAVSAEQQQQVSQRLAGAVDDARASFYLAIRRNELDKKWFLSAYSKQAHPGGVVYTAATTLGTRVVSFEEQNGKLFVFDVDTRKQMSDVFHPQVLVDAYPIVTDHAAFNRLPGSSQYVLIDPTAGLNRFGVVGDERGEDGVRFQVELSFAQRFRRIADGITFEQVYTGYAEVPDPDASIWWMEDNLFRTAGTLGISLRRYSEGPGYTPTPLPPREHYFRSERRIVPNTAAQVIEQVAVKWNVHPGMKPIQWHITEHVLKAQQDPRFQDFDLVGAMKRGIEGWNSVFGFPVFQVAIGDSSLSFADDDKNVVIFDTDEEMPFAMADWRTNPNTGEIRGASIYFPVTWVIVAASELGDDAALEAAHSEPEARAPFRLSWAGMRGRPLCDLDASAMRAARVSAGTPGHGQLAGLTKKQKVERLLTGLMLHEVGHTLGLRHNFYGSLAYDGSPNSPLSTTVMDYLQYEDAVYLDTPGSYDVQAVRYLYGMSPQPPTDGFCTDEDRRTDPYCNTYDRSSEPITGSVGPLYHSARDSMLNSTLPWSRFVYYFIYQIHPLLNFVRVASPEAQVTAYSLAMEGVRPPLVIPPGARADYPARADEFVRRIFARLYLDPASERGHFSANPRATPELMSLMLPDIKAILLNTDGVRSHEARRTMVDVLKAMQTLGAYAALRELRDALTASLPSLSEPERMQTEDLVARITAALSPYYR